VRFASYTIASLLCILLHCKSLSNRNASHLLYFPSIEPAAHPGAAANCPSVSFSNIQRVLIPGTVVFIDFQGDCVNRMLTGNGVLFAAFQPGLNWVAGRAGPWSSFHTYIYKYGCSPPAASHSLVAYLQNQGAFVVSKSAGIIGLTLDARYKHTGIDCFTKTSMV